MWTVYLYTHGVAWVQCLSHIILFCLKNLCNQPQIKLKPQIKIYFTISNAFNWQTISCHLNVLKKSNDNVAFVHKKLAHEQTWRNKIFSFSPLLYATVTHKKLSGCDILSLFVLSLKIFSFSYTVNDHSCSVSILTADSNSTENLLQINSAAEKDHLRVSDSNWQ